MKGLADCISGNPFEAGLCGGCGQRQDFCLEGCFDLFSPLLNVRESLKKI